MKLSRAALMAFLILCSIVLKNSGDAVKIASKVINIKRNNNSVYVQDIMRLSKAAEMRTYMNRNVEPCENFYQFACGNWAKINPTSFREHPETGLLDTIDNAYDRKMAIILKAGIDSAETEVDKKVIGFYESCTKFKSLTAEYKSKLINIIDEFGEMPALKADNWDEHNFDWLETIAKIKHKYGKGFIIGMEVVSDHANNTRNRIYIRVPDLLLDRSIHLDEINAKYVLKFATQIKNNLIRFLDMDQILAQQTAEEILDFEYALALGFEDNNLGLGLDDLSILMTVEELQRKYAPTIDVKKFMSIIFDELPQQQIYEFYEKYFKNLMNVIEKTPKSIVANYIFYNLLTIFFLKPQDIQFKQEQMCVVETHKYFAKNLDNMVYRHYNMKENEMHVNTMWDALKSTFKSTLLSNQLNWIMLATRQHAIEKLDSMKLIINSYVTNNFTAELGELTISSSDYIENVKSIFEWESKILKEKLEQPPKPFEDGASFSYSAVYIPTENSIRIPVSLLQPYFLWADIYPNALKFGTLGNIIAHELIHGFDNNGRNYNKNGNAVDWWDEASTIDFVERTKCFTEQYRRYVYGGNYLPESVSQSENIADNGGVRLAYAAYLKWHEEAGGRNQKFRLEILPTMNYTSEQLFFISYAQSWCNEVHPQMQAMQITTDDHVPGMFRVIGALSNLDEFAKQFNCSVGTKMNPIKKCQIY